MYLYCLLLVRFHGVNSIYLYNYHKVMYCIVKEIAIEATRDSKQMSMHKHTGKSTFLRAKVSQPTAFYLSFQLKK